MADRTLTVAPALTGTNQNMVAVHTGINVVPFSYTAGGVTASVSDVIMLVKIPAGAIITNIVGLSGYTGNATSTVLDIGLSDMGHADTVHASWFASATISQSGATTVLTLKGGGIFPVQCSVSDDAANRFRYLQAKIVSGDPSQTLIVKGSVEYIVGRPTIT